MNLHRVRTIARHEFVTNVRRKEFIAMTLGLPLFMLVIGGLSAAATVMASGLLDERARSIGIVDAARVLAPPSVAGDMFDGVAVRTMSDVALGKRQVKQGSLEALIVVGSDYIETGRVTVYRRYAGLMSNRETLPIRAILSSSLLARSDVGQAVIRRAVDPTGPGASTYTLDKHGSFARRSMGRDAAQFVVPYLFTILLTMSIFFAANYLLRGIADEKENRVIEVVLSSVSAEDLLVGKLVGLGGVGLTQVGVWILLGAVPASLQFSQYVKLSAATLSGVMLFFVLGFALYATLMAAIGALGTSYRESQQTAGMISFAAFFPVILIPVLIEHPNGGLARALSYIPFTSPTTMVLRLTASEVPIGEVLLVVAIIVVTMWLIVHTCARLFRYGLLVYGKRPGLRETWRWMREA